MLNEDVKQLLANSMWDLATCADDKPNVVPVAFKDITDDGKLEVGDVFLSQTLKNLKKNPHIAISIYDPAKLQGYQIQGKASYIDSGDVVEKFKKIAESALHGMATAKGALIITPEKVIVTTPGPDNKKVL